MVPLYNMLYDPKLEIAIYSASVTVKKRVQMTYIMLYKPQTTIQHAI